MCIEKRISSKVPLGKHKYALGSLVMTIYKSKAAYNSIVK